MEQQMEMLWRVNVRSKCPWKLPAYFGQEWLKPCSGNFAEKMFCLQYTCIKKWGLWMVCVGCCTYVLASPFFQSFIAENLVEMVLLQCWSQEEGFWGSMFKVRIITLIWPSHCRTAWRILYFVVLWNWSFHSFSCMNALNVCGTTDAFLL